MKNVVIFGGGSGLSQLLKGLKLFPVNVTAVVSVADNGGSTGALRKEFEILPVSGDPLILTNTVAALSDKSITWTANNKEYYITSNNLTANELATIADSMGSTTVGK